MRSEQGWRRRHAISFAAVLLFHALLVIAFLYAPPTQPPQPNGEEFISTWISNTAATRVAPQRARRLRMRAPVLVPVPSLAPSTLEVPRLSESNGPPVDWSAAAGQAADAAMNGAKPRAFGPHPHSGGEPPERERRSPHYAGEEYTDSTGSHLVWISDSCYIISDPPLPGIPRGLNFSRTNCVDYAKPPGELFKDLPAYKKYHPE